MAGMVKCWWRPSSSSSFNPPLDSLSLISYTRKRNVLFHIIILWMCSHAVAALVVA
jgi:hypothetical protein